MDADKVKWNDQDGKELTAIKLVIAWDQIDCAIIESTLVSIEDDGKDTIKIIASNKGYRVIMGLYKDRIASKKYRSSEHESDKLYIIHPLFAIRPHIGLVMDELCKDAIYMLYESHNKIRADEFSHLDELP